MDTKIISVSRSGAAQCLLCTLQLGRDVAEHLYSRHKISFAEGYAIEREVDRMENTERVSVVA